MSRGRKSKSGIIVLFFLFAAAAGLGGEVTAKWTRGAANAKWTENGAVLYSPRWPEAVVVNAAVALSCSTNAPKEAMTVTFLKDGVPVVGPMRMEPVAAADVFETQSYGVSEKSEANGVCLCWSDEWKVKEVTLRLVGSAAKARWWPPRGNRCA